MLSQLVYASMITLNRGPSAIVCPPKYESCTVLLTNLFFFVGAPASRICTSAAGTSRL